jgi:hypothetical protein
MDELLDFANRARALQSAVDRITEESLTAEQREAELDDLEATIAALEVTAVIQGRKLFQIQHNHPPTYNQLVHWAHDRPVFEGFLERNRDNPTITALFTKESPHGGATTQ